MRESNSIMVKSIAKYNHIIYNNKSLSAIWDLVQKNPIINDLDELIPLVFEQEFKCVKLI